MRLVKYLLANRSDYSWGISTTTVGLQEDLLADTILMENIP